MSFDVTAEVLRVLGARLEQEDTPDLVAAVGVMGDVGRALATVPEADVRALQAAIAGAREKARYAESGDQKPADALRGKSGEIFLSGALWAANDIMSAFIDARAVSEERLASRGDLWSISLELLHGGKTVRPTQIREAARTKGLNATPDRISRVLGELLAQGSVQEAEAPSGEDRRGRYYRLAD